MANGLTLVSSNASGTEVSMRLSGGTSGTTYANYLKATDANGEIFVVNFTLAVTDPAA